MEDIYALLNINKDTLKDFHLQANRVVDHQTELAINRSVRILKDIEVRMMYDKGINVPQQSIDDIIQKVINNAKRNNADDSIWSIWELRIISYYLIKLQGDEDAHEYALGLLDRNWRNLFFNGLSFYCLNMWNLIDPPLRIKTCQLLRAKLQQYHEGCNKYIAMKNHANLFDEAGPMRLSVLLSQKKQDVKEAPSYFSNKPSSISQSYYSDVIINFCNSNKVTDLDYIREIFEVHNTDRTKKLVLADLVERLNDYGDDMQRSLLCNFVNKTFGDITLSSTWAPFYGATEKDAQKLKKAKQLVNLWFNQKIIETFFQVCVQDRDRKDFWLKYVDRLSGFRIVGSTVTKHILQSDPRISDIFLPYFIETKSYYATTSALILFIKNKMIVEFSDTGALYVYSQDHKIVDLVIKNSKAIANTADLKNPYMTNLVEIDDWGYNYYYEQGRMTHRGYWQDRLKGWLQQKVFSSTNTSVSFFDSKDNDIFKAKPIEKEEFKPSARPELRQRILCDNKGTKNTVTTLPKSHNNTQQATSPAMPNYETNIRYDIASEWFLENKYRIVANSKGFYIYLGRGHKFFFLRGLINEPIAYGNIWIRKPDATGWIELVHFCVGREITIGYIKEISDRIWFKEKLKTTDILKIKLN